MKNSATLAIALLAMTLLPSGMASAADPQPSDNTTVSATAPEADPHTLANRNAAAKALKAELDKQNAAATELNAEQNAVLDKQNAATSDQAN